MGTRPKASQRHESNDRQDGPRNGRTGGSKGVLPRNGRIKLSHPARAQPRDTTGLLWWQPRRRWGGVARLRGARERETVGVEHVHTWSDGTDGGPSRTAQNSDARVAPGTAGLRQPRTHGPQSPLHVPVVHRARRRSDESCTVQMTNFLYRKSCFAGRFPPLLFSKDDDDGNQLHDE